MIKNKLKIALLALSLSASSLVADSFTDANSLVGIEGGYSSIGYENETTSKQYNSGIGQVGLKLGAESKDYRVFLSGRYQVNGDDAFEYMATYGGEFQYKFNVSKAFNLFMGINGGIASMKFKAEGETASRTISDPFVGGDLGANIHLGKATDLEFGGRVMSIQATNVKASDSYLVGNMFTGYASLIFKWKMD